MPKQGPTAATGKGSWGILGLLPAPGLNPVRVLPPGTGTAESQEQGLHWVLSRAVSSSGLTSGPGGLTWQCHTTSLLPQIIKASSQFPHTTATAPCQ